MPLKNSLSLRTYVVVAQRSAEHALAPRLDGQDMLAVGEDDACERHAALVLHGIADHREGFLAALAIGNDVVGPLVVALVDLLLGHELVDLNRVRVLKFDRLDLLRLDLDELARGELDGVFKSWAVAKGPSLDPKDKRLAVETEDHPLDYGDFEGTIPKGEYGGGTVMLWDRGFWAADGDPAKSLRKGELRFTLAGEKLQGSWVLVRLRRDREGGKRINWLLIMRGAVG